jgi:hypothetical protein
MIDRISVLVSSCLIVNAHDDFVPIDINMGVHNKARRDKHGDPIDHHMASANASFNDDRGSENLSAMDLEIN